MMNIKTNIHDKVLKYALSITLLKAVSLKCDRNPDMKHAYDFYMYSNVESFSVLILEGINGQFYFNT